METRKALLWALYKVRENIAKANTGICGETFKWLKEYYMVDSNYVTTPASKERAFKVTEAQDLLWKLNNQWPEKIIKGNWLNDWQYPVEGARDEFYKSKELKTLWSNPRRIALLNWLIKELENDTSKGESSS